MKGRKRHLVVDTLGLLLAVSVPAASVQDRDGAHPAMEATAAKYPGVETLFVDAGYAGRCAQLLSQRHYMEVQVVRHPGNRNVGRWMNAQQSDLFTVEADTNGICRARRALGSRAHSRLGGTRPAAHDASWPIASCVGILGLAHRGAAPAAGGSHREGLVCPIIKCLGDVVPLCCERKELSAIPG